MWALLLTLLVFIIFTIKLINIMETTLDYFYKPDSPQITNPVNPLNNNEPKVYTIRGVEIEFPHKAYPSQLSMMDRILTGLTKCQNCLLESPTGSGKSLALLCSALAWQRKFEKDSILMAAQLETQIRSMSDVPLLPLIPSVKPVEQKQQSVPSNSNAGSKVELQNFAFSKKSKYFHTHPAYFDGDDDDDFQPMKKRICEKTYSVISNASVTQPEFTNSDSNNWMSNEVSVMNSPTCSLNTTVVDESFDIKQQVFAKKTPKIYFGTRTHKQISQIIRELKKTKYKDVKMTILSSRERTCINPTVMKENNKQEACNELVFNSDVGCLYYSNHRRVSHQNPSRFSEAFDIEDLVSKLRAIRCCPYFSARILAVDSDIVFCPYNYLIDPLIRASLDINLKGNVLILDEAHNIEDSARGAASLTILHYQISEAIADLANISPQRGDVSKNYYAVCNILTKFHGWFVDSTPLLKQTSFDSATKIYSGAEMVAIFESIDIGPEKFQVFESHVKLIIQEENDQEKMDEDRQKLTSGTLSLLKSLTVILNYIYKDNLKFMLDYRCIFSKNTRHDLRFAKPNSDLSINLCCLNPAVAFSDIKDSIYSLIVASGTLSPMTSFQSELDMPFEIMLEANHVVPRSQMWIGTIGQGPAGSALNAVYRNTEMFTFQDDIGKLVLDICSVIPYGVLCFVSSYGMLDKLTSRWQTTGLWTCLEKYKFIVCEPKGQSKTFDKSIMEFYHAVEESKNKTGVNGALLIAVCRGKVSEGLDFADDNARAVITIGIPFPNFKDIQVELKRKYNDSNRSHKKIMSGSEWYECQAFRALNQALGRCIRHRNDFGALIIVDERFQKQQRYVNCLSKWIRTGIIHYDTAFNALNSLREFAIKTNLNKNIPSEMLVESGCCSADETM